MLKKLFKKWVCLVFCMNICFYTPCVKGKKWD